MAVAASPWSREGEAEGRVSVRQKQAQGHTEKDQLVFWGGGGTPEAHPCFLSQNNYKNPLTQRDGKEGLQAARKTSWHAGVMNQAIKKVGKEKMGG